MGEPHGLMIYDLRGSIQDKNIVSKWKRSRPLSWAKLVIIKNIFQWLLVLILDTVLWVSNSWCSRLRISLQINCSWKVKLRKNKVMWAYQVPLYCYCFHFILVVCIRFTLVLWYSKESMSVFMELEGQIENNQNHVFKLFFFPFHFFYWSIHLRKKFKYFSLHLNVLTGWLPPSVNCSYLHVKSELCTHSSINEYLAAEELLNRFASITQIGKMGWPLLCVP